ncbi:MAG: succinylglutamate desuccinylase/aspartoacylase family protein [Paucibacter sp.]|nr:succinylglutamate desuccinylase/aspartoacylase family protein [Roseateles sp.]
MQTQLHPLTLASAGTARQLRSLHFGRCETGRKTYIQASLHADEVPPMLVAQALRERLAALEAAGLIGGEIVLVPMANPIGLSQEMQGVLCGRFDMATGINFNRNYRHLTAELIPLLEPLLGADETENRRLIRSTCLALLATRPAAQTPTETERLKQVLQTLAMDADIVLDLHCDNQAVMHVYTGTPLAEAARPLARLLGAQALLLSLASGDDPFDETVARIWWELAAHFGPQRPVPLACFAATVELRGELQVEPEMADQDARALLEFLRQSGHIEGNAETDLAALTPLCEATPLEGVEPVTAPHNGILVFCKAPGDMVSAGEAVAEVIDPLTDRRSMLCATVSGRLFARVSRRYASAGMRVCKVAGAQAFRSGKLLSL